MNCGQKRSRTESDKTSAESDEETQETYAVTDEQLQEILSHLNPGDFSDEEWAKVWSVYKNEGLEEICFRAVLTKYRESDAEDLFQTCQSNYLPNLSVELLYIWLKKREPYLFWGLAFAHRARCATRFNHSDMAQLYYNMNHDKYVYTERDKSSWWFEYDQHNILKRFNHHPPGLLKDVLRTLQGHVENMPKKLSEKEIEGMNDKEIKIAKERKKRHVDNIYNNLGTVAFAEGVIKVCKSYYLDLDLISKIDSNINIVAFRNCLFDLEIGRVRKILKSDYVMMNTGYDLDPERNAESSKMIVDLINSIFNDPEVIDYFLKTLALNLFGKNFEKFTIWTGIGRNGKGVILTLLEKAVGSYMHAADTAFLSTPPKSAAPNPVLAQSRNKRFMIVSEPGSENQSKCTLHATWVNSLTGGDTVVARDLHETIAPFKPFFAVHMLCNEMPELTKADHSIQERLNVVHFPNTFIDNPDPNRPNEKLRDYALKEKLSQPTVFNEFIQMLFDIAFANKGTKPTPPKKILESNEAYVAANNEIMKFLECTYCITRDDNDKVSASALNMAYYQYFQMDRGNGKDVKARMTANGFRQVARSSGMFWVGLKERVADA